jgi:hypothetical protein
MGLVILSPGAVRDVQLDVASDASADLRYPIGPFRFAPPITAEARQTAIDNIAAMPARLRAAIAGLDARQLDTPYRPEGWTVRQVVHHLADSHINGIIRVKLALTEDAPRITGYDENAWVHLPDARLDVDVSLSLLDGLHARWAVLYAGLEGDQWSRTFFHPEPNRSITLEEHLQIYGWHSRHHVAHVTALRARQGW